MTLMIDLSAAEEARLKAAAQQIDSTPEMLAKRLVTEHLPHNNEVTDAFEAARIAAIKNACGSMANLHVSVEDLHWERQADKRRENEYAIEPAQ